jgi:tetratricopeptide (TPR) repeat protein
MVDYERVLQIDPDLATAYANRGIILLIRGQRKEAQTDFERCLRLNEGLKTALDQRIQQIDAQSTGRK